VSEHAARLIARLGVQGSTLAADPQLGALLEGLLDRAEGRLPHRPIRRDAMVDRVADALLSSDEPPDREALTRLNASDLYLALAVAAKDMRALEIAESELMPAVRQSVGRIDPRTSFVDEVTRRVRERALVGDGASPPAIVQYRGTGPLARWVRVLASRIALDLKRRADSEHGCEHEDAPAPDGPGDPELEVMWSSCAAAYEAALAEELSGLSRRERNLLCQRYLDDLNIDALGRMYRVSPVMAERWLQQIEARLAAATRAALVAKLACDEAAASRVERLCERQLPRCLPAVLREGEGGGQEP
jgi:RNA polymerase sigma-70 factor (ECF subfamily)